MLIYCGYIGGSGNDIGNGIAIDHARNAYVTGHTNSTQATFPENVGPDLLNSGSYDAFVAKIANIQDQKNVGLPWLPLLLGN